MGDLIPSTVLDLIGSLTNEQRRSAAVFVAEQAPDPRRVAFHLLQLGLAEPGEGGTLNSVSGREEPWFLRQERGQATFTVPADALHDLGR